MQWELEFSFYNFLEKKKKNAHSVTLQLDANEKTTEKNNSN